MSGGCHVESSNDVEEVINDCHPKVTDVLGGSPLLCLDLVGLYVVVVRGQEDVEGLPGPRPVDCVQTMLDILTGRGPLRAAHPAIFRLYIRLECQ